MLDNFFYIKLNADLEIISQYNAIERLSEKYCFELSNIFEHEIQAVIDKKKKLSSIISFEKMIRFNELITAKQFLLSQYLYFLNSYVNKEIPSKLEGMKLEKKEIIDVVQFYRTLPIQFFNLFQPNNLNINGVEIQPFSNLKIKGLVEFIVQLSVIDEQIILAKYRVDGRLMYMIVGGNFEDREYDYLIPYLFKNEICNLNIHKVSLGNPHVNLVGDTYFGESYTQKRMSKKQEDALTQYGYHHSFSAIETFFKKDEFNIVNFETTFNTIEISPFKLQKRYLLGANSQETIAELKKHHFDCICLANNHSLDFGENSFFKTLKDFQENQFITLGAGENQYQANKILELSYQNKKIAIFNGYWRNHHYENYDFYALHDRVGVNILNGTIFYKIEQYKKQNPESLVLCFCHWGQDYKSVRNYQRYLARKLVKSGADLIIGHGAHIVQEIEKYDGKTIIYSIGNGVFNSDGEYDRHQVLPYGLLVKIDLAIPYLKLYPIYSNNLKTFWQPHFVSDQEFFELKDFFGRDDLETEKDEMGYFFGFKL